MFPNHFPHLLILTFKIIYSNNFFVSVFQSSFWLDIILFYQKVKTGMNFIQSFNAQYIILYQANFFCVMEVILCNNCSIWRAHKRSRIFKGLINKNDSACMDTCSADKSFDFMSHFPKFWIILCHFFYKLFIRKNTIFLISIKSLVKRLHDTTLRFYHRSKVRSNIYINTQPSRGGKNGTFRFFSPKSKYIGYSIATINFAEVIKYLRSAPAFNINIYV